MSPLLSGCASESASLSPGEKARPVPSWGSGWQNEQKHKEMQSGETIGSLSPGCQWGGRVFWKVPYNLFADGPKGGWLREEDQWPCDQDKGKGRPVSGFKEARVCFLDFFFLHFLNFYLEIILNSQGSPKR